MPDLIPNVKPGDIITANFLNDLIKNQVNRDVAIRGAVGLTVRREDRNIQLTVNNVNRGFACQVTTAITGLTNVSGTITPGQGQVAKLTVQIGSSSTTLILSPVSQGIYNVGGPQAANSFGNAIYDDDGRLWFIPTSPPTYYCYPPSGIGGATGSWPSLTAATATVDVYQHGTSGLVLAQSGATVSNYYPASFTANKVTQVKPNLTGGFDTVAQSCT